MEKITKEQFEKAYNAHLPNGFIKLAYKYFSTSTEKKDYGVKNTVTYILGGLFLAGLITTILNAPKKLIGIFAITYSILLSILVLGLSTPPSGSSILARLVAVKSTLSCLVTSHFKS